MPDVVLAKILEKLDFLEIISLRKVCHRLHNFIDDFSIDKSFAELKIEIREESINLEIQLEDSRKINIDYSNHENGCLVTRENRPSKFLENSNFSTVFLNDFEIISKCQKSAALSYFKFACFTRSEISKKRLAGISKILETRSHALKMIYLEFEVTNEDQILAVIPWVDQKSVEFLKISAIGKFDLLYIGKLLESEGFRNFQNSIHISKNSGRIQDFLHFSNVTVNFERISVADFADLKEKFLTTPHLESVDIRLTNPIENWEFSEISDIFGPLFEDTNYMGGRRERWFFRCRNGDTVLFVDFKAHAIQFLRILETEVPRNAIVMLQ